MYMSTLENHITFPRIRGGDPIACPGGEIAVFLFPAYAGVIPMLLEDYRVDVAFPRIRGGDPCLLLPCCHSLYFSPHTRG